MEARVGWMADIVIHVYVMGAVSTHLRYLFGSIEFAKFETRKTPETV